MFGYAGMGVWGSVYNYHVASEAARSAQKGISRTRRLQDEVRRLEDKLDKLTLVCMAMWSVLSEQAGVTEEALTERVQKLDLQDGKQDGKVSRSTRQCPQCGHTMSARHSRCLYCGAEDESAGPFGG
jgi:ribosomal protein S27AE